MLNRQEQYWLQCWRRAQSTSAETIVRKQRRNCLGAITHGLYAARILNEVEREIVNELQGWVVSMRAEFPQEGERIEMLVIYLLFLFRALQADHVKAIERSGCAIRTHLNKMTRPRKMKPERIILEWSPEEERKWKLKLLEEIKNRHNIAENTGGTSASRA